MKQFLKYAALMLLSVALLAVGYIAVGFYRPEFPRTYLDSLPEREGTLRAAADRRGVRIGAAVGLDEMRDDRPRLVSEFNSIAVRGAFDWVRDEKLALADSGVRFAEENNMRLLGGPLLWPTDPRGGYPADLESLSPEELRRRLVERITAVVSRYRGRVKTWIVVRDPLARSSAVPWFELGDRPREDNAFQTRLGDEYVRVALEAARAADPEAELFISETLPRIGRDAGRRFSALVAALLGQNAPLDGVGLIGRGKTLPWRTDDLEEYLRSFADQGLKVEIVEFDARIAIFQRSADPYQAQGEYFQRVVAACLASGACGGVTFCGYDDARNDYDRILPYSWQKPNDPLLFDAAGNKKPAYQGVLAALSEDR